MVKFLPKIILISFLSISFSFANIDTNANSKNVDEKLTEVESEQDRIEAYKKLSSVIGFVEQYYVDEIKLEEVVNKAIKGMLSELDSHSAYLDEKFFKDLKAQSEGEFGGLGIVVGMREGALTVISPIDDTPAYKAGVKAGDIIIKINEESTLDLKLDECVTKMRGKPGTKINITVVRKNETKPVKIDIVRGIIKTQSVTYKTLNNKHLYLRVSNFDKNTVPDLKKTIEEQSDKEGIILDLRNNPGGLLSAAIGTLDLFIDEGVLVSQKGREEEDSEIHYATKENTITDLPIVVLVNGGSASASEIVSGSLQDLKRAVIIGEKTFGKGSVQSVIPLNVYGNEGIKLTIAKYYLSSGRTIQALGIEPDITVFPGEVVLEEKSEFAIKEADLKKHLESEIEKTEVVKEEDNNKNEDVDKKLILTQEDLNKDNQLNSAVNILKALILTNK